MSSAADVLPEESYYKKPMSKLDSIMKNMYSLVNI